MVITLKNISGRPLSMILVNEEGEQDTVNLVAEETIEIDDVVLSQSHGVYNKLVEGRLEVILGTLPAEVFADVDYPAILPTKYTADSVTLVNGGSSSVVSDLQVR